MSEVEIEQWGRAAAIRLPAWFLAELGLRDGDRLSVTVKDGKCYLEPVRTRPGDAHDEGDPSRVR